MKRDIFGRFEGLVDPNGPYPNLSDPLVRSPYTRCHIWEGRADKRGYGRITHLGRPRQVPER